MKLIKTKTSYDYDHITIETVEGKFSIYFENNLDLYWYYFPQKQEDIDQLVKEFRITKENYSIYYLFERLYNSIKNQEPFGEKTDNKYYKKYQDELSYPFKENKVEWHSDDFPYDEGSVITIESKEDEFLVTFKKSESIEYHNTYTVRFRNSGSFYKPYNTPFMLMYNALKEVEYDEDYHQIHFEEYLYSRKLIKKNN